MLIRQYLLNHSHADKTIVSVNQNKFLPPSSPPLPPLVLPLLSGHHFLATLTFCSVHCSRGSSQHTSLES